MELKIIEEKENPLFKRKEIIGEIETEVTPSHDAVFNALSKKFSVNTEVIKIKKIEGKFGSKTFKIIANIYNSKEDKVSTEIKKKREIEAEKKIKEAEAAKAEAEKPVEVEKPAELEAPKEETPAETEAPVEEKSVEEVKEEPKPEEKKE